MNEQFQDDETFELTDDSHEFVTRQIFLEQITEAHFLLTYVQAWAYQLRAIRTRDLIDSYHIPTFPAQSPTAKRYAEEAISDLFLALGWGDPFYERQTERDAALNVAVLRIEDDRKADKKHLNDLLQAEGQKRYDIQERIKTECAALLELLGTIERTEVTHSERRGQLKLLAERLRHAENNMRFAPTDIPF